jgi:hypothetical protein
MAVEPKVTGSTLTEVVELLYLSEKKKGILNHRKT